MVRVVFVDVFGDGDVAIDTRDLLVDVVEQFAILDGRWEALHYLKDFDLEPWAWRHVVIVVCRVLLNVLKNLHELGEKYFEAFWTRNFYRALE